MKPARDPRMSAFAEGLDALRHEQFTQAVERLEVAEELSTADGNVPAYLSSAYLASGRPLEAQAAIDRAIAIDPDGFAPQLKAGELAFRLGNLSSAERDFLAALRAAEPGTADMIVARRWLAITRERRGRSVDRRALLPRLPSWIRIPRLGHHPRFEEEPS